MVLDCPLTVVVRPRVPLEEVFLAWVTPQGVHIIVHGLGRIIQRIPEHNSLHAIHIERLLERANIELGVGHYLFVGSVVHSHVSELSLGDS